LVQSHLSVLAGLVGTDGPELVVLGLLKGLRLPLLLHLQIRNDLVEIVDDELVLALEVFFVFDLLLEFFLFFEGVPDLDVLLGALPVAQTPLVLTSNPELEVI